MKKLPKGWSRNTVDELFDVQLGKMLNEAAKNGDALFPYLTNANVQWAKFNLGSLNTMHFSQREREKFALKFGDLLICEGGEVGRCAIWKNELSNCYFQKAIHRLRPKNRRPILSNYMLAYMQFIAGSKLLGDLTSQSSIAHLTREKLLKLVVALPPLAEQQIIADILSTWDEALEKLDALIAAKTHRKQALMQQLLTGHRRLPGFSKPWIKSKLGDLFLNRTESNRLDLPLLSITADQGVVSRDSLTKRDTSSEDKSKYLRIIPGDIGYNTMRMWQGVSALSSLEGIVSPAYTILNPTARIDGKFAAHFFKLPHTISLFHRYSQGLVDDTLNLKFPAFAVIEVTVPADVSEQRAIAAVLDTAEAELRLLRQQRTALDHQKRGLMQKLLTGKVRVST